MIDPQNLVERVLALLFLTLASPLLILIVIAIVIDDPGPALFRQIRVGRRGKNFRILKFRTMSDSGGARGGTFEPGDRSRVTRVGEFLRRTKLDELPQLFNVVAGDMGLVGPRPEVRKWVDAYPNEWAEVLERRPGITDPAALVYRDEEEILAAAPDPEQAYREEILPRKLALYREYSAKRTIWTDLEVILDTIRVLLFRNR